LALLFLSATMTACATARDPRDPLEPLNRGVYRFNEAIDKAVLKPVAKGYKAAVPPPLQAGVTNFFGNFRDVTTAINDLLQGKLPFTMAVSRGNQTIFRARFSGFDEEQAREACKRLTRRGVGCFPLAPHT